MACDAGGGAEKGREGGRGGGTLHAAGEFGRTKGAGDRRSARFEVADGRIYCDNFVVFFYL